METGLYVHSTAGGFSVVDTILATTQNCYFPYNYWTWDRYYPIYYPIYNTVKNNNYEVAFKIMMDTLRKLQ